MRKSLVYSRAALSILLVLSATTNTTLAANYAKVGVQVGDTAVYHASVTGTTVNKTEMLVYGIVGSTLYLNLTNYYPNNTVQSKWQVITDTVTSSFFGWAWIVAGNLTTGDPIYSGATLKINETKSMNIGGVTRTVNHLNLTSAALNAWWDKTLGVMVKINLWFFIWMNYTMISFTSPGAPAAPSGLSLSTIAAIAEGAIIVLLIAYIVMGKRGGKRGK